MIPGAQSLECEGALRLPYGAGLGERLRALVRRSSPQDWVVGLYLVLLNLALLPRLGHLGFTSSALQMSSLLVVFLALVLPVRSGMLGDGLVAPFAYRVAIQGTLKISYFFLGAYLPLVNPGCLDGALYTLDLRLFGFEPSLAWQPYVTPFTTEWFAFFYFCYFILLVLHAIPIVWFERREQLLAEFTLGITLVFCLGHIGYLLVPGYGPVRELASVWQTPLPSGPWMKAVLDLVAAGGAQKDVFPSLHTAAPVFICLFSFRHRRLQPFKYTWPLVAFFSVNIVLATMFLRWHWLIDVVAGVTLAVGSWYAGVRLTTWDLDRRRAESLGPGWPRFGRGRSGT
jgi:hypothetical protein